MEVSVILRALNCINVQFETLHFHPFRFIQAYVMHTFNFWKQIGKQRCIYYVIVVNILNVALNIIMNFIIHMSYFTIRYWFKINFMLNSVNMRSKSICNGT